MFFVFSTETRNDNSWWPDIPKYTAKHFNVDTIDIKM